MKLFKTATILAILAISIQAAQAKDISIYLGGYSKHYLLTEEQKKSNLNEKHNTLGVKYGRFLARSFTNTFNNQSYQVGCNIVERSYFNSKVKAGFTAGFVSGYEKDQLKAPVFANAFVQAGPIEVIILPSVISIGAVISTNSIKRLFR